jgi:hypothetical protein
LKIYWESAWYKLTEVGWQMMEGLMEYIKKIYPERHPENNCIERFSNEGDTLFEQHFNILFEEREPFDMKEKVQLMIQLCIEDFYCMVSCMCR